MTETIGIIMPSIRPHLRRRAERMATLQKYGDFYMIPVEGTAPPGIARNAGMAVARQRGIRLVSFWDDDDFYGPGHLAEQLAAWRPGRIVGKTFGFVALNGGVVYFPLPKDEPTHHLLIGGSIFGDVNEMPDWTEMPTGEDGRFCFDCRKKGLETYVLSGCHFVYSRLGDKSDHTFRASDGLLWYVAGDKAIPTNLTPEAAMVSDVPTGQGISYKAWLETLRR